jgi:hypothetical protein
MIDASRTLIETSLILVKVQCRSVDAPVFLDHPARPFCGTLQSKPLDRADGQTYRRRIDEINNSRWQALLSDARRRLSQ